MYTATSLHPTPEQLAGFDTGELPPTERQAVEDHVAACESCCEFLKGLRDDSFVTRMRALAAAGDGPGWTPVEQVVPETPFNLSRPTADEPGPPPTPAGLVDHPTYRVLKPLGWGGMGVVYLAEHKHMNRRVALKVIRKELITLPTALDRFRREVKAAASLSHPNIVMAHDAGQAGDDHFLVMEYVEGTNLGQLIKDAGPLPAARACDYVRQAALGLQHAFERGMVHRDIKPHNMIVSADGCLKVLDFGLARFVSELTPATLTGEFSALGAPDYMAPEQADDAHRAETRADIYSLGCTLYHLLAGKPPFAGGSIKQKLIAHTTRMPVPLREHRVEVPAGLEAVLRRMLAKDPADRFQTPAEVAEALEPFTKEPAEPEDAGTTLKPTRGMRSRWLPWVVAAGIFAAVGLGAIITIKTDKGELVIETTGPDIEVKVVIRRDGEVVEILDSKTKSRVTLPSGRLSAELKGAPGLMLEANEFVLKRGGEVIVKVKRKPVAPPDPGDPLIVPIRDPGLIHGLPVELKEWFKETRIGEETRFAELQPEVAMDRKGRFVVVWLRQDQDGKGWGVYARRFDENHKPTGPEFRVDSAPFPDPYAARIGMTPDGRFVVAWSGIRQQGSGVYLQRFTAAGEREGTASLVIPTRLVKVPSVCAVAMNPNGEFIVLTDGGSDLPGGVYVFTQRFDAAGKKVDDLVQANTRTSVRGGEARLALALDGRFAVAFKGGEDILVSRFKADGSPDGKELVANTTAGDAERAVGGVAFDDKGNLSVVWSAINPGRRWKEICLRRYDPEGKPLDPLEGLVRDEVGGRDPWPALGMRGEGDFLAVWNIGGAGTYSLVAQYVDADARPRGPSFLLASPLKLDQRHQCVAVNELGLCVVVWAATVDGKEGVFARGFQLPDRGR